MNLGNGMRQNFFQSYRETEILQADPIRLVCLLYRGAIERVEQARACLQCGDIAGRSAAITKATGIINELVLSLDHEQGGELSANLLRLYDYILRRLNEGNFRQTDPPLAEAEQLLRTLVEGWEACNVTVGGVMDQTAHYAPVSCAG